MQELVERKIINIKRNIDYYTKVYPGCKKLKELKKNLKYYQKTLAELS